MDMKETNTLYTLYKMIMAIEGQINVSFFCNSFEFTTTFDGDKVLYDHVENTFKRFKEILEEFFDRAPKRTFRSVIFKYINGVGLECQVYFDIIDKPTGDGNPQNRPIRARYPWGHSNGEYHGDEPTEEEIDHINGQGGK